MKPTTAEQLELDAAVSAAAVLEASAGGGLQLSTGEPASAAEPTGPAIGVEVPEAGARVALAVVARLAAALEQAPDVDATVTVAATVAEAARVLTGAEPATPSEVDLASFPAPGVLVVSIPVLEGVEPVAELVVATPHPSATDGVGTGGPATHPAGAVTGVPAAPSNGGNHARHALPGFEGGNGHDPIEPTRLELLNDVEMSVTVELGHTRMLLRDLLSLTPGAVVALDRSAGSPVDVLVNGTLIARGEVVVVDEEFGIRVTEIVAGAMDGRRSA